MILWDGEPIKPLIMQPFLRAITPAIMKGAKEIKVYIDRSRTGHPGRFYYKTSGAWQRLKTVVRPDDPNLSSVLMRVRIFCKISIESTEQRQTGTMHLRCGRTKLACAVEIVRGEEEETLTMRLQPE